LLAYWTQKTWRLTGWALKIISIIFTPVGMDLIEISPSACLLSSIQRWLTNISEVSAATPRSMRQTCANLQAMGSEMKQLDQPQDELDQLVEKYLHAHQ